MTPQDRREPVAFVRAAGGVFLSYARGQIIISLILSGLYAIGFALLGMPLWPLIALLCGFLNLIPYIGGVIALLIAVGSILMVDLDWYRALGVLGVYAVVQMFEGLYLTPKILGRNFEIRTLHVFVLLLAAGALAGPVGMMLAVPVFVIGRMAWRRHRGSQRIADYPPPPERS
jgi:predicted PurR-regulated permease PerM